MKKASIFTMTNNYEDSATFNQQELSVTEQNTGEYTATTFGSPRKFKQASTNFGSPKAAINRFPYAQQENLTPSKSPSLQMQAKQRPKSRIHKSSKLLNTQRVTRENFFRTPAKQVSGIENSAVMKMPSQQALIPIKKVKSISDWSKMQGRQDAPRTPFTPKPDQTTETNQSA